MSDASIDPSTPPRTRVEICGLPINVFSSAEEAAEVVVTAGRPGRRAATILTCNVDHVVLTAHDSRFLDVYRDATLVTADGAPVVLLSRLMREPVGPRVTGADLLPLLARVCRQQGRRLAVVGGPPGVSDRAVANLAGANPGLDAVTLPSPQKGFEIGGAEDKAFVDALVELRPDVVAVCFGAPKQEFWMQHHRDELLGAVLLGAGAAVDFAAGTKSRAPVWVQRAGAEWLYRLATDFRRLWRRYLVQDREFFGLAWRQLRSSRRAR